MSELVSRLRSFGGDQPFANEIERLAFEAAAEITRLRKELETAREDALEDAAWVAEGMHSYPVILLHFDEEGGRHEVPHGRGGPGARIASAIRAIQKKEATE